MKRLGICWLTTVAACLALAAGPAAAKYTFVRTFGKGGSHVYQPWGVAVDGAGHVFVTYRHGPAVEEFTGTGHLIRQWSNHLSIPEGDAVTANGKVFVGDSGNNDIIEYTPSGHFVTLWHQFGPFLVDFVAAYGNTVWYAGQWITVPGDPAYRHGMIQRLGGSHPSIAYGSIPWGIAFGPFGQLYIARPQANDVLDYNTQGNGTQLHAWGSKGKYPGQFDAPGGIAVDRWGNVYVTDDNDRVSKFTSDGTYLDSFGSKGKGAGKLSGPVGIAVDASGDVFVADSDNDRMEEFAPVFPQTTFSLHVGPIDDGRSSPIYYQSSSGYATFQCKVDGGPWHACGTAHSPGSTAGVVLKNLSAGEHTFEVRATDSAGNTDPTPAKLTFLVDRIPPVPTAPVATLTIGTVATLTQVPVNLSWTAHDNYTAMASLNDELQRRSGTPSSWDSWTAIDGDVSLGYAAGSPFLASYLDYLVPSSTRYHEYRAEARDQAGNKGVSPAGPALRAVAYQDSDPVVKYTGTWTGLIEAQYPQAFDGIHNTGQPGASVSLTFHGSSIGVLGSVNPWLGTEKICLDPGTNAQSCSTITATSTATDRQLVFVRDHLSSGAHTVRLRDESGIADIDAFEVLK